MIWKFAPEGFAATVGKTYTVRAVVKVDPRTPYDSMYWCVEQWSDVCLAFVCTAYVIFVSLGPGCA